MEDDRLKLSQWNEGVKDWGARQHLSPRILHIIDNLGVSYKEMEPGQALTIYAEDAVTKRPSSFIIEVLSVRKLDESKDQLTVTLRYVTGDFGFYRGENPGTKPVKLLEGTLMESGISGNLIPQTDLRMVYLGGIGLTRDHSFEYLDGNDKSIIVHNLTAIDIGGPSKDWQQPDLTEYFEKLKETKLRQEQEKEDHEQNTEKAIEDFLNETFKDHPMLPQIQARLKGFSPNGKTAITSFFAYALEDGVLDKAWQIFNQACAELYNYQHPAIRGDADNLGQNRENLVQMIQEAGIKWPRLNQGGTAEDWPELDEIPVIKIPEDKESQAKLGRKLVEYQDRIANRNISSANDARHKAAVLGELLEKGAISIEDVKSIISKEPWFSEDSFERAVLVINEYCIAGGQGKVVGGTGLK